MTPPPILGTDYSCPIFVASLLSALLKVVGSSLALIRVSLRIPLHRPVLLFHQFHSNVFKGGSAALQTRHMRDSCASACTQGCTNGCRWMQMHVHLCAPFRLLARCFNRKLLRAVYGRCSGRSRRAGSRFISFLLSLK